MSLTKTYESRLIRTIYEVAIFTGTDVAGIRADLAGIPNSAKMVESWEDDRGGITMKFMVESETLTDT